jgi:hypothetical protein
VISTSSTLTGVDAAQLAANLHFLPLDFLRTLDLRAHAQATAQQALAPLPAEQDLRFVHDAPRVTASGAEGSTHQRWAVIAQKLDWDSEFFGYPVARLDAVVPLQDSPQVPTAAQLMGPLQAFLQRAVERKQRYIFAAVDAEHGGLAQALCACGFALIETRATYARSLMDYSYPERFATRLATADDAETLAHTAADRVNPYDRFHADPFIDPERADALMRQWVHASLTQGFADATVVPSAPQPTAFCTVKYHRDQWDSWGLRLAQPVLSAVSTAYRGWYKKIMSEVSYHLKDLGAEHAYMVTQVTNRAVIKTWERLGYSFGKAQHIFRIVL